MTVATALIVVPARYASQRLPGKPLINISGRTLLERTVDVARRAAACSLATEVVVATDDDRIAAHATAIGARVVLTDAAIASGTGRALAAAELTDARPDIVANLQGDAPFTPARAVADLIAALRAEGNRCDMATPVVRLDWQALDALRAAKAVTPFSGTTCVVAPDGRALWFSKSVLPAMRDEAALRAAGAPCPVLRHVGLYAYRYPAIALFETLGISHYEALEGLEQLRMLEAGLVVRAVEITTPRLSMSGIDSPEDVTRAEALIAAHGDPFGRA